MVSKIEAIVGVYPHAVAVAGQGFDFRPNWWTSTLPTDVFDSLPVSSRGETWRRIERSDLFEIAASPGSEVDLLIACYAWGMGPSTGSLNRYRRALRSGRDLLAARLAEARGALETDGPVEAYRRLAGGSAKIAFLGPSFFTKLLYALDHSTARESRPGNALILDQFVVAALNDLAARGIDTGQHQRLGAKVAWSANVYDRWLDFAHTEASYASSETRKVTADAVEIALFKFGRGLVLG